MKMSPKNKPESRAHILSPKIEPENRGETEISICIGKYRIDTQGFGFN